MDMEHAIRIFQCRSLPRHYTASVRTMQNHNSDIVIYGASGMVLFVSWVERALSHPSPELQNIAYVAAIVASLVGIYYKVKHKGKD